MKPLTLIVFTLLALCLSARSQLTLNSGDSYTYQFSTLPLTGFAQTGPAPSGLLGFTVNPSSLQPGDTLLYEMFEDTVAQAPICSGTFTTASPPNPFCLSIGAWQDLQGTVRFTVQSGSITLDGFTVQAIRVASPQGLNIYQSTIVPVPEPSAFMLLGAAIVAGLIWDGCKKLRPKRSPANENTSSKP